MRALLELIYPPRCASCASPAAAQWCEACARGARRIRTRCRRCGYPWRDPCDACPACVGLCPPVRAASAVVAYQGPARDALLAFKVGGERRRARLMAAEMAAVAPRGAVVVVAVPATRRAVAARGFDAALELARPLARELGLPLRRLLRKVAETADQAGLDRATRYANLRDAFDARGVPRSPVLLVDDILTTGATATACADVLLRGGAACVDVVTYARTLRPDGKGTNH